MTPTIKVRFFSALLGLGLVAGFSTACIIETSDGDGGQNGTDGDDGDDGDDGVPDDSVSTTSPQDDGDDDGIPTDDTGGEPLPGECSANLVADPGFESGSPNASWQEASALFGSPICDTGCSEDPGALPHSGDYWVWFGGSEDEAENASVSQNLTIPSGDVAQLSFWVSITSGAGPGDDIFSVSIDGTVVFMLTDADMPEYDGYRHVALDVTDFADDEEHALTFSADITGVALTSFFVDDVELVSCSEPADTTDDGDTTGDDATGTTGDTETDTGDSSDTGDTETTGTTGV